MSRHLEEVATSTLNQKLSRHQLAKKLRSRHHSVVVTSVIKKEGRDIIQQSRHHQQKREGRDNSKRSRRPKPRLEVATSFSNRDISCTERRSRHHSVVATSLQGIKVVISLSSCDNRSKEKRSRHPLQRPEGRDIIQWSRHQLPRKEVATSFSCRDNSCIESRSRQQLHRK